MPPAVYVCLFHLRFFFTSDSLSACSKPELQNVITMSCHRCRNKFLSFGGMDESMHFGRRRQFTPLLAVELCKSACSVCRVLERLCSMLMWHYGYSLHCPIVLCSCGLYGVTPLSCCTYAFSN
jgi:hypothetical protein